MYLKQKTHPGTLSLLLKTVAWCVLLVQRYQKKGTNQ